MRVSVTIEGLTPLLMNRFVEKGEIGGSGGTSPAMIGSKGTPREQAEPKAYRDADSGILYIPGTNVYAAIIAAGKFHKSGKSKLTTQKTSLIPAGVLVEDLVCSLGTKDFEVDSRSVVIPSTGGRIMCHRPRLDSWQLTFHLDIDTSVFDPKLVRLVIDDAGRKIGLGDYRPERKGPFGRFVVKAWAVADEKIAA